MKKSLHYFLAFIFAAGLSTSCKDDGVDTRIDHGELIAGAYKGDMTVTDPADGFSATVTQKVTVVRTSESTANLSIEYLRFPVDGGLEKIGTLQVKSIDLAGSTSEKTMLGPITTDVQFDDPFGTRTVTLSGDITNGKLILTADIGTTAKATGSSLHGFTFSGNKMSNSNDGNTEAAITGFDLSEYEFVLNTPVISGNNITFVIDPTFDVNEMPELKPEVTLSDKASYNPNGAVDFRDNDIVYYVTSENEVNVEKYIVSWTQEPNTETAIDLEFDSDIIIENTLQFNPETKTFTFEVVYGTSLSLVNALMPEFILPKGATLENVDQSELTALSFDENNTFKFVVRAEDQETTETYTITWRYEPNTEAKIESVKFIDNNSDIVSGLKIEGSSVKFNIPFNTTDDQLKLKPEIEVSSGAEYKILTEGVELTDGYYDLSGGFIDIEVKAESGATSTYRIEWVRLPNDEAVINNISLSGTFVKDIVKNDKTFNVTVYGDAPEELKFSFTGADYSENATLSVAIGSILEYTGSNIEIIITSEDGKNNDKYYISVNRGTDNLATGNTYYNFDQWESKTVSRPVGSDQTFDVTDGWCSSNEGSSQIPGGPYGWCLSKTDGRNGGSAAKLTTLWTEYWIAQLGGAPKITSGSMFTGGFDLDMEDNLNSTKFGEPFESEPLYVTGYFQYSRGATFYKCTTGWGGSRSWSADNTRTDMGVVSGVLYEVSDDEDTLTGHDLWTSDKIVSRGRIYFDESLAWTEFRMDFAFDEGKSYTPGAKYKLALVFASSYLGDAFEGAPNSALIIDDVTLHYK